MADHSVFSTARRTPSAQMDADLSTLHAPEAAAEVVDEGCRRARERGEIDIVRSAICIDKDDKRMAIRRTAHIGANRTYPHAESSRLEARTPASSTIVEAPKNRCWRLAAGQRGQQVGLCENRGVSTRTRSLAGEPN
jgi:hypothetical protein